MANCPQCGNNVPDGAKFCPSCGAKMAAQKVFCPECGTELGPNVRFCPNCGTKNPALGGAAPEPAPKAKPSADPFGGLGGGDPFGASDPFGTGSNRPFGSSGDAFGNFASEAFGETSSGFDAPSQGDALSALENLRKKRDDEKTLGNFKYESIGRDRIKIVKLTNDIDIEIEVPNSCAYIGDEAFAGTFVKKVIIHDGCNRIGKRAFAGCRHLEEVVLPAKINRIEEEAFADCPLLDFDKLPEIAILADNAFNGSRYEKKLIKQRNDEAKRKAEELAKAKKDLIDEFRKDLPLSKYRPQQQQEILTKFGNLIVAKIESANSVAEVKSLRSSLALKVEKCYDMVPTADLVNAYLTALNEAKEAGRKLYKESDYYPDQRAIIANALKIFDSKIDQYQSELSIKSNLRNHLRDLEAVIKGQPTKAAVDAANQRKAEAKKLQDTIAAKQKALRSDNASLLAKFRSAESNKIDAYIGEQQLKLRSCESYAELDKRFAAAMSDIAAYAKKWKTSAQYQLEEAAAAELARKRKLAADALAAAEKAAKAELSGLVNAKDYYTAELTKVQAILNVYYHKVESYSDASSLRSDTSAIVNAAKKEIAPIPTIAYYNEQKRKEAAALDALIDRTYAAAEKGDAQAAFDLANFYSTGKGVTRSPKDAFYWYGVAAKKGHQGAMERLGDCYMNGEGTAKDYKEANKWYTKASK